MANRQVRPVITSRPSSTISEDLVYNYALRIAYLSYLTEPKVSKAPKTTPPPVPAALEDLKNLINNVNRNDPFPACKDDFESNDAYNNWKAIELKTISDIIATMVRFNPNLGPKASKEVLTTLLTSSSNPSKRSSSPNSLSSNPNRSTYSV
ncbi:18159_t:CDS:2 [Entrophospora sp. SA101]|nr:18159_t:CDS:2 [Entrophospora sp. SA101]